MTVEDMFTRHKQLIELEMFSTSLPEPSKWLLSPLMAVMSPRRLDSLLLRLNLTEGHLT